MSTPDRRLNLVFQGGGIRGIAYVGALELMPPHLHVHVWGELLQEQLSPRCSQLVKR